MHRIMFNDLYNYVPDSWKFYITSELLMPIINMLNKHSIYEVTPKKEDIFACFSMVKPEDVSVIIIGEQTGDPIANTGIAFGSVEDRHNNITEKFYKRISVDYDDDYDSFDKSLHSLVGQGVLLLNYPLTATKFHRKSHRSYGWDNIIKSIIYKLLYRESSVLCCVAWNLYAYSLFKSSIGVMFPCRDNSYYTSSEYSNVYLFIGSSLSQYTSIMDHDKRLEKEYKILSAQYDTYKYNHCGTINEILRKNNKKSILWV